MDLLLGSQHLLLVLLEVRSNVTFGIFERLLALVVGRDFGGVGVSDLDVVAEDLVESDLQAGDSGAADLLSLKASDPILPAAGDRMELIECAIVAPADHTSFSRAERRLVHEGGIQQFAQIRAELQAGLQVTQQGGPPGRHLRLDPRQQPERAPYSGQVARPSAAGADPRRQPGEIKRLAEPATEILAQGVFTSEFAHGIQTRLDGRALGKWGHDPFLQQPRSHRRHGTVQHRQQ